MDPKPDPNNEISETQQSTTGAATAPATHSREPDSSHTEEVRPGAFGPFRYFINNKLRNSGDVTVPHGEGAPWIVQELTIDGLLRLRNPAGDDFALVPLDERYIPGFFDQIL